VDETGELKWLIASEIPHLRRYARSLAGEREAADDLVQDCLEKALRRGHLWRRTGSLRSWLFSVLHNLYIDRMRRDGVAPTLALEDIGEWPSVPARQERRVECLDVVVALERLPARERAALMLVALEDLPYDEAARILGLSLPGLRTRLFRARERLRRLVRARPARRAGGSLQ